MISMTGYAYTEKATDKMSLSVEIKSVNSRFLDIYVYMPSYLNALEQKIRAAVAAKVFRGKVEVSVRIKETDTSGSVTVDENIAKEYALAIKKVAEAIGASDEHIPLSFVLAQQGVLSFDKSYDAEKYWDALEPVLAQTLQQFYDDREREGKNLRVDFEEKIKVLEKCHSFFRDWQPKMETAFKEQLTKKFAELLGEQIDEQRVLTETAAMLVKYTINEEIVRLGSHLTALRAEIENNPAPGKKIDFLAQEINREINTIGSKNQFSEVSSMVITAKDAVENIREQARNVE